MSEKTIKTDEQKVAEAEVEGFRKDLGPFVVAAETTRMPMVFTDAKEPGNPIIFANASFLSLTGYERNEVLGQSLNFLMTRGADPQVPTQIDTAFAFEGSSEGDLEVHFYRKDGSKLWASISINPVRDKGGRVVEYFVSVVDISKYKQAQVQATMLIDELNHRVKNTLSTVQSIVSQAFRKSSDVIQEAIEDRIFALSRSHDLLTRESWEGAGLVDIVHAALEPFEIGDRRAKRLVITGSNIRVTPKATLVLGIALHELATNAVKYGAFSNNTGSILITWTIEPSPDGDRLILHWQEKGGPPVTPPSHKGFGSHVIERGLAHELGGSVDLDYHPGGVICTINIPAPRGAHGK
jgi:PAS domain S-box-containing protein